MGTDLKGDKLEIHNHRVDSSKVKLSGRNIKLFVSHNFLNIRYYKTLGTFESMLWKREECTNVKISIYNTYKLLYSILKKQTP